MNALRTAADAVGRGLLAGLVGTAAMTISSSVEARLSGRGPSNAPADAAAEVAGVEPTDQGRARFNTLVHWAYGTGWGAVRGLIGATGIPAPAATLTHLGAVWSAEQALLPALDVAPPVWTSGSKAVATDLFHHTVYAVVTGAAYSWLSRT